MKKIRKICPANKFCVTYIYSCFIPQELNHVLMLQACQSWADEMTPPPPKILVAGTQYVTPILHPFCFSIKKTTQPEITRHFGAF